MLVKLARFISTLLHPVFVPSYAFLFFWWQGWLFPYSNQYFLAIIAFTVFFLTAFMPLIICFTLLKLGFVQSLEMETSQERRIPFLINAIFYIICYSALKRFGLPSIFEMFLLGSTAISVIAIVVNYFWKISIHMLAMGSVCGVILGLSYKYLGNQIFLLMILLLISAIIGSARLLLGAHKPAQIYVGFACGLLVLMSFYLI